MPEIQRWTVTEPYLDVQGQLFEGPYYDEARNHLRWVDILEEKLYILDLARGPESLKVLDTGVPLGVTANLATTPDPAKDEIVVGAKHGYATLDLQTGKTTYIRKVWTDADGPGKEQRMRFNDGAVDSRGRFWAGMMTDLKLGELVHEGVLFRLDPDLSLHRMIEGMGISNGIGWSLDDRTMYITDTPTRNIFAYDFDAETGQISNRRVFFTPPGDTAMPDGFAMDEEGHLWVALWDGSRVLRVSPQGQIVGEISLPARCVTCATFVGTDLYITTANEKGSGESDRYGGKLYRVNVGVRGKPKDAFRLTSP
ncbi:hypothetical protein VTO42DRAFT_6202 [Malbranchea cinnamomea]